MFKAAGQYCRDEVAPRWTVIATGIHIWVALLIGAVVGWKGEAVFGSGSTMVEAVTIALTYAAIAFGFCIAGLTMALTLDRDFALDIAKLDEKRKAEGKLPEGSKGAYSDLIFVFSWTAVVHWMTIVASVLGLILSGGEHQILSFGSPAPRRLLVGATAFLCAYGLFQFLITLITLSQVADVYIDRVRSQANGAQKDSLRTGAEVKRDRDGA